MTNCEPLSDDDLQRIRRDGATVDDFERLIAQSREYNKLKRACGQLAWKWLREHDKNHNPTKNECHMDLLVVAGYFGANAENYLMGGGKLRVLPQTEPLSDREQEMRFRQRAPDDPAARAKRELGEWLVSPEGQGFSFTIKDRGPTWISQERWRCVLRGHTSTFTRCEPDEHLAITAALRAAKAKEAGR